MLGHHEHRKGAGDDHQLRRGACLGGNTFLGESIKFSRKLIKSLEV